MILFTHARLDGLLLYKFEIKSPGDCVAVWVDLFYTHDATRRSNKMSFPPALLFLSTIYMSPYSILLLTFMHIPVHSRVYKSKR